MDALPRGGWRRAVPIAFALVLALVEFAGVAGGWTPSAEQIRDAFFSSALVYALFATSFVLSGLVASRGAGRWLALAAFQLIVTALSAILFSSWVVRWLIGRPLSGDAAQLLVESATSSILQLGENDPRLLLAFLVSLLLFVYACTRMLHYSAKAWAGGNVTPRALTAGACVLVAGLSTWQVASAERTGSSYAVVIQTPAVAEAPIPYNCPRADRVPITPMPVATGGGKPVIVIVLESLRADLLRDHPEAMPFLSSLARESVVFEKAYAPATQSDLSDIAIWYSRHALYGERRRGYPVNAPWRGTSAFEYFKAQGYRTAYFSSQNEEWGGMIRWMKLPAVDAFFDAENLIDPQRGDSGSAQLVLQQAKAEYTQSGKVPDYRTLELAGDWLERNARQSFFMGMNLQNTHFAYLIPRGGVEPFQPAERGLTDVFSGWPKERTPFVRNRYLNAVFNMDALIASFAQRMRAAGIWDRSIVLFVGDHGEAFGEHGYFTHGGPGFEETSRVLAILKLPAGSRRNGSPFSQPVSSIDFLPMVTQLAGLPAWQGFQGRSPFTARELAPVYLTVNALTREDNLIRWPWKLMSRTFPDSGVELYDLQSDPDEMRNVALDHPDVAAKLATDLGEWHECQTTYYSDPRAYERLQPPRYR